MENKRQRQLFSRLFGGEDNGSCTKNNIIEVCPFNVHLPCEQSTSQCFQYYQSSLDDLTNYISDGCFDEIIIVGDFNCDPNKGRFFRKLQSMANRHILLFSDVEVLPASTHTNIN